MPKFSDKKQDALKDDPDDQAKDDAAPPQDGADAAPKADAAPTEEAPADAADAQDAEPDHAAYHETGQPHIDLKLFVASHPAKNDQLAGFASYARQNHTGKYTREQWDGYLAAFNDRPIR